ncbi:MULTISPECIES: sugar phosphate nucleotidyltransferase [Bacillus cereus group]|nr:MULTISPECIES: sugar phosphate nucleotidyltransferase [Bacillus cereus group]MDA1855370.1 sugar phosphate nucleotidyltransferase [Bacillus cereus]MEB9627080.1 sugar phosphate nucleotidyltransferase [Bacillus anthracis]OUA98103.1 mannose-1-phosphate guanylyltransferase [Bacillus thuringiensis serovar oswaldocruzi]WHT89672.1 sugar phosphate nucleotidyltransferase [Bacillus cereus]
MKLILLSGGSGKRLWPLSNDSRSKQFLKVLKNNNDEMQSMVQRVWGQLTSLGFENDAVIATSKSQVDMINSQLGNNVPIIIEPERRDTFPAIALAASYLYSKEHVDLDEVVGVLPVDPYVENSFFERLLGLENALNSSNADLGLMGITPTYPSEKYGYIVPNVEKSTQELIQVSHFKEKPATAEAEELLKQNALWNSGVFAFKLDKIISLLDQKGLPVQYDMLVQQYASLPKISFDYEVVEKTENIVALPYNGSWKDLGTWNTLTEEMGTDILGKGNMGIECEQNHIINELDIPVSVLGLSNIIVAVSPDGILVSEKDASPRVKELVGDWDQRPMYEERRWGWYRVLDHTKYDDGNEVLTKRIGITASKNLSYQYHNNRSEVWTIVKGEGIFVLDDEIRVVRPGDVLEIHPKQKHAIKAVTDLEFIEVQSGSELVEEDIVRVYMQWNEIEEVCYLKK